MLTCAVVCASTEVKSVADGHGLTMKPVVACFGLGIFLFVFSMASTNLAQKFCYLCIAVALLRNGIPLITAVAPAAKTAAQSVKQSATLNA